jgi:hypothetical protein
MIKFHATGTVLVLLLATYSQVATAFSLSELSYNLLIGECSEYPKTDLGCKEDQLLQKKSFKELSELRKAAVKNSYIQGLAQLRKEGLDCAITQINDLQKNEKDFEVFLDFYSKILRQIGKEKRTMRDLQPAITTNVKAKEDYKKARLRAEVALSSLPYSQTNAMKNAISLLVDQTSQNDFMGKEILGPAVEKLMKDTIKTALIRSKEELRVNSGIMYKGSRDQSTLSRVKKESLAQDTDLVESYRKTSPTNHDELEPVACQFDAEYGRGAQYRDNAILVASVLGTAGARILRLTAASLTSSSITGAAAMGAFSARTAGMLRTIGVAAGSATIYKQVEENCLSDVSLTATSKGASTCETNIIRSLEKDNCTLSLVLAALGGAGAYKHLKLTRLINKNDKSMLAKELRDKAVILDPKLSRERFNLFENTIHDNKSIYLGVANTTSEGSHHYYIIAGNRRFDGMPFFAKAKTKTLGKVVSAPNGVIFKISGPEGLEEKVIAAINKNQNSRNLSCFHGACNVLKDAGITIPGANGRTLELVPVLKSIATGDIKSGASNLSVKVLASSKYELEHFITEANHATSEMMTTALVRGAVVIGTPVSTGGFAYVIYIVKQKAMEGLDKIAKPAAEPIK